MTTDLSKDTLISAITDGTVVTIRPGDVVVIKVARPMSQEDGERLRRYWDRATNGIPCVIVNGQADLAVLRREDA